MTPQEILKFYMNAMWHGLSPGVITMATAMATLAQEAKRMPLNYEWTYIIAGFTIAFISGVNSFLSEPK